MTESSDGRQRGASPREVTHLLRQWSEGDESALAVLMATVHGELRRLARSYMRREREGHTLEPTALVHEAYIRLVDQHDVRWASRGHFFAYRGPGHASRPGRSRRGGTSPRSEAGGAERVTLSGVGGAGAGAARRRRAVAERSTRAPRPVGRAAGTGRRTALLRGDVGRGGGRGPGDFTSDCEAGMVDRAALAGARAQDGFGAIPPWLFPGGRARRGDAPVLGLSLRQRAKTASV